MKVLLDPRRAAPLLRSLPPVTKRRLKEALRLLGQDPTGRSNNLDIKRLDVEEGQPIFRLRVGDWRAAFAVDRDVIVLRIFHRDEGYEWLEGEQ